MNPRTRDFLLKVLSGEQRLLPFLFLVQQSPLKDRILETLIIEGRIGRELWAQIERDFHGDVVMASRAFISKTLHPM
jgi:hypothetical protein